MDQAGSPENDRFSSVRWSGPDGQCFTMREVTKVDTGHLRQLARDLSHAALYFRFGRFSIEDLDDAQILAIRDFDPDWEAHWIVHCQDGVDLTPVADARYVIRPDRKQAEILMLVTDRWQKSGIGKRLLDQLSQCARAHGLEALCAQVLLTNWPMRAFLVSQSFEQAPRVPGRPLVYVKKLI